MISATEALRLAPPTIKDIALARDVMDTIDQHIRKKMTFAGPETLEIPPDAMSYAAAKLIALKMKDLGWNVSASLGVMQTRFGGQTTIWQFAFSPAIETYEAAVSDINIDPKPQLM